MDTENPIVNILDGQLKGTTMINLDDEKFYAFLGIPYAKPPVGELRFKAPVPVEPWNNIKDASKEGEQCFQGDDNFGIGPSKGYIGSEDCLFLNVYTRSLPKEEEKLKPVMVYIHGGAFMAGSGGPSTHGPELLMAEDIVLVTINYRLGVLGFLSLKDSSLDVPGNAGLKDQTMALKWVQKNIEYFNGDHNNVTIFGESAGGVSVHYQILSPTAKGLFHKAIVQSGTAFCPWATSYIDAYDFIPFLNKETKTDKDILSVLSKVTVEDLWKAQDKYRKTTGSRLTNFGPVIEQPNKTEFITKEPVDIIISGEYNQVPIIFGYTSNEGLLEYLSNLLKKMHGIPIKEKSLDDYIPKQINLKKGTDEWNLVEKKMEKVYMNEENKDNPYLVSTDSLFLAGTVAAVHNHLKVQKESIFLYRVSVITTRNFSRKRLKIDPKLGVCHADEMGYLFSSSVNPPKISKGSAEDIAIRRFVKLWTNFARFGNPTPDQNELGVLWKTFGNAKYFLDIGNNLILYENPEQERMELWKSIFKMNSITSVYLE